MNWYMVAVVVMQIVASLQGFLTGAWRIGTMNVLVGLANIVLAGARA